MLRLVPDELREASYALGIPKWSTIVRIVLPTAMSGIITGSCWRCPRHGRDRAGAGAGRLQQSINYNPFSGNMALAADFIYTSSATRQPGSEPFSGCGERR